MPKATEPAHETRSSLPPITPSLLSQNLASILSSPTLLLIAPPNSPINNLAPRILRTQPTISTQSTSQLQNQRAVSSSSPLGQSPTQDSSAPINIPTSTPTFITHISLERRPARTWLGLLARIHHRDDDVRDYCAPESNGWMAWQEKRVAGSQMEIGRIDYSWDGGRNTDFAEIRRQRRRKQGQRMVDWTHGVAEEGGKVEGEEQNVVEEDGKVVREGEKVVEDIDKEQFYDCLESLEGIVGNAGDEIGSELM